MSVKRKHTKKSYTLGWVVTLVPAILMLGMVSGVLDCWISDSSNTGKEAETLVMANDAAFKIAQGDYNGAYATLTAAIKQDQSLATPFMEFGKLAVLTGKYDMAENYYLTALKKKDADQVEIFKGLAEAYMGQKKVDKALSWLYKAVKIEEQNYELWHKISGIELKRGNFSNAELATRNAIDSQPGLDNLYTGMLRDVLNSSSGEKFAEAIKVCQDKCTPELLIENYSKNTVDYFLQDNKDCVMDYLYLSEIMNETGYADSAVGVVEDGLEIFPSASPLYNQAGRLYGKQEKFDKAEVYIKRGLAIDGDNPALRNNLKMVQKKRAERNSALQK